jgi:hypothetical protein
MSQFSLKRLLLSVLLVAVGVAACVAALKVSSAYAADAFVLTLALWIFGGAFVGAGAFCLFKRAELGALVGVVVQLLAIFALGFKK